MFKNQKGSVVSVAVIIIVLLSFTLTTVTAYTVNTANSTRIAIEKQNEEVEGKRLINQAINYLTVELEDIYVLEGFQAMKDIEQEIDFRDTQEIIPMILDEFGDEELGQGLDITRIYDFLDGETAPNVFALKYRFAFPLSSGRNLVKYLYISSHGTHYQTYTSFDHTIGTDGHLVMNGGDYVGSLDDEGESRMMIYGRYLYTDRDTLYRDATGNMNVVRGDNNNLPIFDNVQLAAFQYLECKDDCIAIEVDDITNDVTLNYSAAEDMHSGASTFITNLFSGFVFNEFFLNTLYHKGIPFEEDTFSQVPEWDLIQSFVDNMIASGELTDVTGTFLTPNSPTLSVHSVYDGNLVVNKGANQNINMNENILIVLGDMTIESLGEITGLGSFFIFGDLYIVNDSDIKVEASIYTTGETLIEFAPNRGFERHPNKGFSLFSKGNVFWEYNSFSTPGGSGLPGILLFTEASILLNVALGETKIRGAIYAQGKGDGLPGFSIVVDGTPEPFKGILINSYRGIIDTDTGEGAPGGGGGPGGGQGGGRPGGGPPGNAGGNAGVGTPGNPNTSDSTFQLNAIDTGGPTGQIQDSFINIPTVSKIVLVPSEDELATETTTFLYE